MESDGPPRDSDTPRAQLAAADLARERLSARLRLPKAFHPALGVVVAIQIGTAAAGIASQTGAGMAVLVAGLVAYFAFAAWALRRFRQINGVRVDGLASQIVLGTGATASVAYVGGFAAATWAAFESQWWLVAIASVAGGVGYALGARQWWHAFRADPASRAGGASPRVLALLAVAACAGLALLLALG